MKQFEIGKKYFCHSACQYDCVWFYIVTARTANTVTLKDDKGQEVKRRIIKDLSSMNNAETVYPLGKYSFCPTLRATNL